MTHLNVPVKNMVNLVTMQLPKDNSSNPFYYDRQGTAPFSVPKRCAFVITDVFVNPEVTSFAATMLVDPPTDPAVCTRIIGLPTAPSASAR